MQKITPEDWEELFPKRVRKISNYKTRSTERKKGPKFELASFSREEEVGAHKGPLAPVTELIRRFCGS